MKQPAGAAAIRYRLYDDRYGYPGVSDVAGCENCGHLCTTGHLTDDEISRLYTEYYPRTYASRQDGSFNEFIGKGFNGWLRGDKSRAFRWVPENVRVLDIGCGYGNTMEYHRRRGCDVYGVELDEPVVERRHLKGNGSPAEAVD